MKIGRKFSSGVAILRRFSAQRGNSSTCTSEDIFNLFPELKMNFLRYKSRIPIAEISQTNTHTDGYKSLDRADESNGILADLTFAQPEFFSRSPYLRPFRRPYFGIRKPKGVLALSFPEGTKHWFG